MNYYFSVSKKMVLEIAVLHKVVGMDYCLQ